MDDEEINNDIQDVEISGSEQDTEKGEREQDTEKSTRVKKKEKKIIRRKNKKNDKKNISKKRVIKGIALLLGGVVFVTAGYEIANEVIRGASLVKTSNLRKQGGECFAKLVERLGITKDDCDEIESFKEELKKYDDEKANVESDKIKLAELYARIAKKGEDILNSKLMHVFGCKEKNIVYFDDAVIIGKIKSFDSRKHIFGKNGAENKLDSSVEEYLEKIIEAKKNCYMLKVKDINEDKLIEMCENLLQAIDEFAAARLTCTEEKNEDYYKADEENTSKVYSINLEKINVWKLERDGIFEYAKETKKEGELFSNDKEENENVEKELTEEENPEEWTEENTYSGDWTAEGDYSNEWVTDEKYENQYQESEITDDGQYWGDYQGEDSETYTYEEPEMYEETDNGYQGNDYTGDVDLDDELEL